MDGTLDDVAQTLLGVFLLLISAEIAFGPSGKLRVTGLDAILEAADTRQKVQPFSLALFFLVCYIFWGFCSLSVAYM